MDPTAPDGESGLALASASGAVTLVVLLEGPSSAALIEYAQAEELTVAEAAAIYLDQVTQRTADVPSVTAISTDGIDAVDELVSLAHAGGADRVVLPASLPGLSSEGLRQLVTRCPVPVVVMPATRAA